MSERVNGLTSMLICPIRITKMGGIGFSGCVTFNKLTGLPIGYGRYGLRRRICQIHIRREKE